MKGGDFGNNELQSSSAVGACGWICEGHERGVTAANERRYESVHTLSGKAVN